MLRGVPCVRMNQHPQALVRSDAILLVSGKRNCYLQLISVREERPIALHIERKKNGGNAKRQTGRIKGQREREEMKGDRERTEKEGGTTKDEGKNRR